MKRIFLASFLVVSLAACNNSADSTDNKKDSLDSLNSQQKERVDSSAEQKKDALDSSTQAKKDALDKADSAKRADSVKHSK
jgi:hypothetical protein